MTQGLYDLWTLYDFEPYGSGTQTLCLRDFIAEVLFMTKCLSMTKGLYDSGKDSYSMTQGLGLYDSMIQGLSDSGSL